MKYLVALLVISIYIASGDASCSDWQTRMMKYASLANCERYVAKTRKFYHFYSLDNLHIRPSNKYLYSFTFSSFADTIRLQLSEGNSSDIPAPAFNLPDDFLPDEEEWETSTYSAYPEERDPPPRYEQRFYMRYNVVIGAVTDERVYRDNRYHALQNVESYIEVEGKRIRTLNTPNIIRKNEPNEVRVEMFPDGRIAVTVNDATTLETRIPKLKNLKYYSFGALKRGEEEEYFHNCKINFD